MHSKCVLDIEGDVYPVSPSPKTTPVVLFSPQPEVRNHCADWVLLHRFGKPLVIDIDEVELIDVVLSQLKKVMPGLGKELFSKALLLKERYVATADATGH